MRQLLLFLFLVFAARPTSAATRTCADTSFAEVNNAVNGIPSTGHTTWGTPAADRDIVKLPEGSSIWTSSLLVTNDISIIGAGEGLTIITENLTRTGSPKLIEVNLSRELPAPDYSFRLSGMTIKSLNALPLLADGHAFIEITGTTSLAQSPYVLGCVSRVRVDHLTFDGMAGITFIFDSVIGVGDHVTNLNTTTIGYFCKIYFQTWTPWNNPNDGTPMTLLASNGYGSWADDPYWGSDKYWVWEDSYFNVTNALMDPEKGGRVTVRHCTIEGGTLASHGMEGGQYMGVKQEEVYNNYFIDGPGVFGQLRSGTALIYNNVSTANTSIESMQIYRGTRTEDNWGAISGDNRYDNNAGGAALYTGTVTALEGINPSNGQVTKITDSTKTFVMDFTDGSAYTINNLDDPFTVTWPGVEGTGSSNDLGWQWYHCMVYGASGSDLTVNSEADGGASGHVSAHWAIGNHYEIRKVLAVIGQIGQGKGKLLRNGTNNRGGYETYFWPATSGTKATYPQAGFPLEPLYMWNNVKESDSSQLGMSPDKVLRNTSVKADRDFFELGARAPLETQQIGYPPISNTQATSNLPLIGPSPAAVTYTPLEYPHPLVSGDVTPPDAPTNFAILANPVLTFQWDAFQSASSYRIYELVGGTPTLIATTNATSLPVGTIADGSHAYVVAAVVGGVEGLKSAEASIVYRHCTNMRECKDTEGI